MDQHCPKQRDTAPEKGNTRKLSQRFKTPVTKFKFTLRQSSRSSFSTFSVVLGFLRTFRQNGTLSVKMGNTRIFIPF
jgi:hypothetical protein